MLFSNLLLIELPSNGANGLLRNHGPIVAKFYAEFIKLMQRKQN